jgi:hypothetical protein
MVSSGKEKTLTGNRKLTVKIKKTLTLHTKELLVLQIIFELAKQ